MKHKYALIRLDKLQPWQVEIFESIDTQEGKVRFLAGALCNDLNQAAEHLVEFEEEGGPVTFPRRLT